MKDFDWVGMLIIGAVMLAFGAFVYGMFRPRTPWTTDVPGATCVRSHVGQELCVKDGVAYVCVEDWDAHHKACGRVTTVPL